MPNPFAPPAARLDPRPRAITWFRAYTAVLAVTYGAGAVGAAVTGHLAVAVALAGIAALHAAAAFVRYTPGGWTLGLVTLAVGVAGLAFVFALPLLVAWNRPLVRAAFGRPP